MNPNNQQQLGMNFNTGMGFPAMNMQFQATDPNSNQPQQANFQMNMGGFGFGMSGPFTDPNQQPQQQQFPPQKNFQQPTQQFPQQQQPQQFPQQQQPQQFPQQQPQQFPQQQPQQFPQQQQPQQFPQQQAQQFPQQQPKQFPQQQPQQFPQQQPQHFPQQQPQQFPQQQPQHFPQQQPQQFPQQQQQQPFQQMPQVQVQFQMPQQPQGFQQPQQQQFNPPPQQMQQPQFNQGGFGPQQFNHLNKKVQNYEWSASSKHPYFDHKLKGICKRSKLAGNVYANRPCFDDFFGSEIHKEFHDPEITAITVYYTHQGIVGIQCDYKNLTKSFQGACHKGFHKGPVESKTIKFSFGEHIESIKGRAGQYIERLDIKTDSNQEISVGGNGGQPFGNILTGGYPTVWAFGGSLGEYLESIYALYQ